MSAWLTPLSKEPDDDQSFHIGYAHKALAYTQKARGAYGLYVH